MQQYQELSAERVTLKAENERLKKDAETAKAELAGVRKERDALKSRAGADAAELDKTRGSSAAAEQALADNHRKLEELVARYRETATTLRGVETDRARFEQEASRLGTQFDTCAVRNVALYELTLEALARWEHEGFFSRLGRSEPFIRVKRTELENLVDEYRERASELKLRQTTPAPTGATNNRSP